MNQKIFRLVLFIALLPILSCDEKSTDARDIFVGIYSVTETWTENGKAMSKPAFSMTIGLAIQNEEMVLLNNFGNYGAGTTVEATASEYSLTVPQQTLPNSKVITGTGKTSGPTLTLTYTEKFDNISIEITATAKKK